VLLLVTIMSEVFDVDKYVYSKEENYFFDANIWLSIFSPNTFDAGKTHDIYTRMFSKLLDHNCNIYTNNIIVSEVVNRMSQAEYKLCRGYYKEDDPELKDFTYKNFRGTDHYKDEVAFNISCQITNIAAYSKLCDLNIENDDLLFRLADIFENCKLDFNDIIFLNICEENNLILITHDGDFKDYGIKVITANRTMLDPN
jgi:predicted nucleic acid-binding protein